MSTWSGVADAYTASFATLCAGTIERLLTDTPGARHLDVGSGTGSLAARASELGRTVVALDADPAMVGLSNAAVPGRAMRAALPDLPFDDGTFDSVTANFVLNHVGDPRAAMRDLARVTSPGGRVAATIWPARNPVWAALVADVFDSAGVVPITGQGLSAEFDFERSIHGLTALARAVGLETLTVTELSWEWEISDEALWCGIAGGVATVGRTYLAQTPSVRAAARDEFFAATEVMASDGMLRLPSTAVYLLAAARDGTPP